MNHLLPYEYQAAIDEVLIDKKLVSDVATKYKIAKRTLYSLVKSHKKPSENCAIKLKLKIQLLQQQLQILEIVQY